MYVLEEVITGTNKTNILTKKIAQLKKAHTAQWPLVVKPQLASFPKGHAVHCRLSEKTPIFTKQY